MDIISKIRSKYNEFMLNTKSIDTIFTKKVEDYILLEESPISISIGEHRLIVGNFNFGNEQKFFKGWANIIAALSARIVNMELIEERKKELLEKCDFNTLAEGKWMLEFLMMDGWLFKALCKLLKKTLLQQEGWVFNEETKEREFKMWNTVPFRYFKKHMSKEKLIQICWLIYLYNWDSQKKSLALITEKMGMKSLMETYIPFWLQNLSGLTGTFLLAQSESIDLPSTDWLKGDPQKKEMTNEETMSIPSNPSRQRRR